MKSHLTAIPRKDFPTPVRWLLENGYLFGDVLDYGCGRCEEINTTLPKLDPYITSVASYDPSYAPMQFYPGRKFDVILCIYVLCVLDQSEERAVLDKIRGLLKDVGVAYIAVRTDKPKWGWGVSKKGTIQRKVELDLPVIRKTSRYQIFVLTPSRIKS
jgi:SAM-dependent methyltransferase